MWCVVNGHVENERCVIIHKRKAKIEGGRTEGRERERAMDGSKLFLPLQLLSERRIDKVINLLPALHIKRPIPPRRAQLRKRRAILGRILRLNKLNIVSREDLRDSPLLAVKHLVVVSDEVVHPKRRLARGILKRVLAELLVHLRVEVADQEVRPELVHDLHVVVDVAGGRGGAVLERARADLVVWLAGLGFSG